MAGNCHSRLGDRHGQGAQRTPARPSHPPNRDRYDGRMTSPRPQRRTLRQRIMDHLFFSVVVMTLFFMVLSLMGIKAKFASLVLSILLTLALNVGLSYYYEWRRDRERAAIREGRANVRDRRDGDIRMRDEK